MGLDVDLDEINPGQLLYRKQIVAALLVHSKRRAAPGALIETRCAYIARLYQVDDIAAGHVRQGKVVHEHILQVILFDVLHQQGVNGRNGFERMHLRRHRGERQCVVADIRADVEHNRLRQLPEQGQQEVQHVLLIQSVAGNLAGDVITPERGDAVTERRYLGRRERLVHHFHCTV